MLAMMLVSCVLQMNVLEALVLVLVPVTEESVFQQQRLLHVAREQEKVAQTLMRKSLRQPGRGHFAEMNRQMHIEILLQRRQIRVLL